MTKPFSKLYTNYWINPDNRELVQLGIDVKLMAIYLQGNSHHNILGVYYLPILYVANDLKLSPKKVQVTLKKLCEIAYCKYDVKTQYIWVCNMALEQIGEEIANKDNKDNKDNRIKAIQAIWNSLPIQVDFLSEVYNRYHLIFNLAPRLTDSLCNKVKNNSAVKKFSDSAEVFQNINIPVAAINLDLEKEPSKDDHQSSIFPTIDLSLKLTSSFEGGFCNKAPLQSPPMVDSSYNFSKNNMVVTLTKGKEENCSSSTTYSDTFANTQDVVNNEMAKSRDITSTSLEESIVNYSEDTSKGLINTFVTPSKELDYPFEAPSKGLQNPSEALSEALRSNIEYISKNIEDINKKEEVEKEKKKDINLSNVLIPEIVVQARPYFEKPDDVFNSLFLKQQDLEETEKAEAVDAKKQLIAYQSCNPPVVTAASRLDTNSASAFSVSSNVSAPCNNSIVPVTHTGSVVSVSAASADAVKVIFEHWKTSMNHPRAKLDCKRSSLIRKALKMGYTVQELCDAVTGCSLTPHNTGENLQGQRYDGLHVIFKDADQIDRFIYNCHHPPKPKSTNEAIKRQEDNLQELNKWLESKNKSTETTKK